MAVVKMTVDASQVDRLFEMFVRSIGPSSLTHFLRTDAAQFYHKDIFDRFLKRGDAKAKWAPLKESTQSIRWDLGFSANDTNVRTGDMERWILGSVENPTAVAFPGGAQVAFPGNPPDDVLRTKLETAQKGNPDNIKGYGPTEPRPVLAVAATDLIVLMELLARHMVMYVEGSLAVAV